MVFCEYFLKFHHMTVSKDLRAIAIDDDPIFLLLVKQLCSQLDNITLVKTYNNAISGAAGIVLDRPDLVFLDIEMPEFSGLDMLRSLSNPPKVIVISSNTDLVDEAMNLRAISFLCKPIPIDEFKAAVEEVQLMLQA